MSVRFLFCFRGVCCCRFGIQLAFLIAYPVIKQAVDVN